MGPTELGGQRFRCSHCGRRFTRRTTSAFPRRAFPDDVIALAVRWYVRFRLSYVDVSEWLAERGVLVDQSTIYRWVQRFLPLFGDVARHYCKPVGPDWRVDETYARIRGRWHYIYRAIDECGQIVDAYVSPSRDMLAACTFFERGSTVQLKLAPSDVEIWHQGRFVARHMRSYDRHQEILDLEHYLDVLEHKPSALAHCQRQMDACDGSLPKWRPVTRGTGRIGDSAKSQARLRLRRRTLPSRTPLLTYGDKQVMCVGIRALDVSGSLAGAARPFVS